MKRRSVFGTIAAFIAGFTLFPKRTLAKTNSPDIGMRPIDDSCNILLHWDENTKLRFRLPKEFFRDKEFEEYSRNVLGLLSVGLLQEFKQNKYGLEIDHIVVKYKSV